MSSEPNSLFERDLLPAGWSDRIKSWRLGDRLPVWVVALFLPTNFLFLAVGYSRGLFLNKTLALGWGRIAILLPAVMAVAGLVCAVLLLRKRSKEARNAAVSSILINCSMWGGNQSAYSEIVYLQLALQLIILACLVISIFALKPKTD